MVGSVPDLYCIARGREKKISSTFTYLFEHLLLIVYNECNSVLTLTRKLCALHSGRFRENKGLSQLEKYPIRPVLHVVSGGGRGRVTEREERDFPSVITRLVNGYGLGHTG